MLEGERLPGGVGRVRLRWIARGRDEQLLVLGHDAAEGVVGGVPAAVLAVPLVHREAVDPRVGELPRVRDQPEPTSQLHAQLAEDLLGVDVAIGDHEHQVAGRGAGRLRDGPGPLVAQELGDRCS